MTMDAIGFHKLDETHYYPGMRILHCILGGHP